MEKMAETKLVEINNSICEQFYYFNNYVQYKMPKYCWHREFSILAAKGFKFKFTGFRNRRMHSPQHFQYIIHHYMLFKNHIEFNCYHSLAVYDTGVPMTDVENGEKIRKEWNSSHFKYMIGYDFMLDIDALSHEQNHLDNARRQALKLYGRLLMFNIPFRMYFSGCGFHFIVPFSAIPGCFSFDPANEKLSVYKLFDALAENIKKGLKLTRLDTSIYDSRRLIKVPYSLAVYKSIYPRALIKLPVTPEQLAKKFNLDDFTLGKVNYKEMLDVIYNSQVVKVSMSDLLACFYSLYNGGDEIGKETEKKGKFS